MIAKLIVVASGGVLLLILAAVALGAIVGTPDGGKERPSAEQRTGDEALDAIIDDLLTAGAPALAARFAGVAAREGAVVGGPVGLFDPRPVDAAEWTARLAAAGRRLHAVVKDPREPYAWQQPIAPPLPRAAVYAGEREYDVVLVVEEPGGEPNPWRFSVLDGRIVDVVIDNQLRSPGQPQEAGVPLVPRLANLTPSPEREPDKFAVLPPESEWLPPLPLVPAGGGPPSPPPAPVAQPSYAPDGRTGDAKLDAVIDALLTGDAKKLASRFDGLAGRESRCFRRSQTTGVCYIEQVRVPLLDWTSRLAGGGRELFAAVTDDPVDVRVFLTVHGRGDATETWAFGIDGGEVVELAIGLTPPDPSFEYERFYVLPPRDKLPQAPAGRPLSVRAGDPGADRLLALVEAKDAPGLLAGLAAPDSVLVRDCPGAESVKDAAFARGWAGQLVARVVSVHAVARVPAGAYPAADHLLVLVVQDNPCAGTRRASSSATAGLPAS